MNPAQACVLLQRLDASRDSLIMHMERALTEAGEDASREVTRVTMSLIRELDACRRRVISTTIL